VSKKKILQIEKVYILLEILCANVAGASLWYGRYRLCSNNHAYTQGNANMLTTL